MSFCGGERVRHKTTGQIGRIEQVRFGSPKVYSVVWDGEESEPGYECPAEWLELEAKDKRPLQVGDRVREVHDEPVIARSVVGTVTHVDSTHECVHVQFNAKGGEFWYSATKLERVEEGEPIDASLELEEPGRWGREVELATGHALDALTCRSRLDKETDADFRDRIFGRCRQTAPPNTTVPQAMVDEWVANRRGVKDMLAASNEGIELLKAAAKELGISTEELREQDPRDPERGETQLQRVTRERDEWRDKFFAGGCLRKGWDARRRCYERMSEPGDALRDAIFHRIFGTASVEEGE